MRKGDGVVCENEGKAPDQVRCDGKEGQCVKAKGVVMEWSNKKNPSSKKNEEGLMYGVFQMCYCLTKRMDAFEVPDTAIMV